MKKILILTSFTLAITGCGLFGINPSPPGQVEKAIFNDVTNYVVKIVPVTNTITITNLEYAFHTNETGVLVIRTNEVTVQFPHITEITNVTEVHTLTPNDNAKTGLDTAGSIANYVIPGSKGIVTLLGTVLLGLWGHLRSYKGGQTLATQQATSSALTQEMETVLEFIKALPNGAAYESTLTTFLQQHQAEAGVLQQVVGILKNEISNPEARVAAQELMTTIDSLKTATTAPRV